MRGGARWGHNDRRPAESMAVGGEIRGSAVLYDGSQAK